MILFMILLFLERRKAGRGKGRGKFEVVNGLHLFIFFCLPNYSMLEFMSIC